MPLMAYCPFDQGALVDHPALRPLAERQMRLAGKRLANVLNRALD